MNEQVVSKKKHRKVGRPKKRGPKKKRRYVSKKPKIDKRTLISHKIDYQYKIVECRNGKEMRLHAKYTDIKDAYAELKALEKIQNAVLFSKTTSMNNCIKKRYDSYLLLEKNESGTKKNAWIRDNLGKYSEVETTKSDWVIVDKIDRKVEETFYVFGYDKVRERKTLRWIYDNIVLNLSSKYDFKRILVYKNKFVVKNDDNSLDIVFCKTVGDAIRFYNVISSLLRQDNVKNVYLLGSYSETPERRKKIEDELVNYTGMSRKYIVMNGTSRLSRKRGN